MIVTLADRLRDASLVILLVAAGTAGAAGRAEAGPRLTAAQKEQAEFLCRRTEFSRAEVRHLQRSPDFPLLLAHALDACPAIAAILSEGAPGAIAPSRLPRDNDEDRAPGHAREEEPKDGPKGI